jgi:hypothetical protein
MCLVKDPAKIKLVLSKGIQPIYELIESEYSLLQIEGSKGVALIASQRNNLSFGLYVFNLVELKFRF